MEFWKSYEPYLTSILILTLVAVMIWLFHLVLRNILLRAVKRTKTILDDSLIRHTQRPFLVLFLTAGLLIAVRSMPHETGFANLAASAMIRILSLLMIGTVAWLILRCVNVLEDYLLDKFRIDVADNLQARKIHTQLHVIRRVVGVTVFVIAAGAMLMTFEQVRQLGTSILASAGIVSIIAGLAAQRSLSTLFAGLQIAITQPVRIDDVVIVEGEWGRIEEITLTYVVVKIWDLRRLIVPITYFIEKPFQNWTRVSADILGSVFLYLDYGVPLEDIGQEFQRLLEDASEWDRKVCSVQVTNTSEKTMEVRLLMSANDASAAWNLRCMVREKMIVYMKEKYPDSLPRIRAELTSTLESKPSSET